MPPRRTPAGSPIAAAPAWYCGSAGSTVRAPPTAISCSTLARRHVVMILDDPNGYQSSIYMTDAGTAVAAALRVPAGIYNVVDDRPLSKRQFAYALATAVDATPWIRGPGRAAKLLGSQAYLPHPLCAGGQRPVQGRERLGAGLPSADEGWRATTASSRNPLPPPGIVRKSLLWWVPVTAAALSLALLPAAQSGGNFGRLDAPALEHRRRGRMTEARPAARGQSLTLSSSASGPGEDQPPYRERYRS